LADGGGTANAGTDTASFTRTVAVTSVNDAPSGMDAIISGTEDVARTLNATDFGFTDTDGNTLFSVVISTLPATGTLRLNGNAVTVGQAITVGQLNDNLLVYTPAANANGDGVAALTFRVRDNGGTANGGIDTDPSANTLTFNVTAVNDAPTVTITTAPSLGGMGMAAQWTDLESGSGELPANIWGNGATSSANRIGMTVTFGNGLTGSVIYNNVSGLWNSVFNGIAYESATGFFTAAQGLHFLFADNSTLPMAWEDFSMAFSGNFDLDYSDQTGSHFRADVGGWGSAVFRTFTSTAAAGGASFDATEQTASSLKGSIVLADVDAGSSVVTATLTVVYGVLNVGVGTSGATIVSGNGTGTVVVSGTIAQLNDMLGSNATSIVTFTADTDAPPSSSLFTISVNDNGNTGTGGAQTGSASQTITITAVDDAPVAVADSATTAENATVIINVTGNDTDVDGGPRTVTQINGVAATVGTAITLASGATATNNGDGTITYNPNGAFDSLPGASSGASNLSAPDSFTYMLNGGSSATVSLTVTGVDSNDTLNGTAGNDTLDGGNGNDVINGYAGSDLIIGGASGDTLTGGADNDTFVYQNVTDSNSTERDGIQDFALGDIIDVTAIDANINVAGNQDFLFVGTTAFSGTAGELRYENISAGGPIYLVQGDVDGDGVSDLEIVLVNTENRAFTRADFAGVITNFAPVAVDDALTATEDTAITYTAAQLTGNDTDADNNPLYISSVSAVSGGTVVLNGDGTVTFTPDGNFNGDAVFDYTTADGNGGTDVGRATVAVSAVNDAPVVTISPASVGPVFDQLTLNTNNGYNISSFVEAENFTLGGATTLNRLNVFLLDATNGTSTFDGFSGTLSFAIYADNGSGLPGTLLFTGADTAPVATDTGVDAFGRDIYQLAVNLGGISLPGGNYFVALHEGAWLSATDNSDLYWMLSGSDATGDTHAVTDNETAPDGTYVSQSQGLAFSLTGPPGATEQLSYNLKGRVTVSDVDAGSFIVTATLSVGYGILKVTAGTSGATVVSGQGTDTVVLSGTIAQLNALLSSDATSTVRYIATTDTPPASTNLTVSVNDNGSFGSGGAQIGSATQVITITAVNDAPVVDLNGAAAGIDTTASYTEGATPIRPLLGMTITDVDSGTLSGATVTIGTGFVAGDLLRLAGGFNGTTGSGITYSYNSGTGVLTLTGVASLADYQTALAALSFKSNSDDPGTARDITVVVNDGSENSVATHIMLTVSPVNDAPVNIVPGAQSGNAGSPIVFSAANGNALSVTDADAGSGTMRVKLTADHGTMTLASMVGVTVTGDGTGVVRITGTLSAINAALEGLTYQSEAGYVGADVLTMTTSDFGNSGSGGPLTDVDSVAISVDVAVAQEPLSDKLFADDRGSDVSAAFASNDNGGYASNSLDGAFYPVELGRDLILASSFLV
jgi:Ca2+-binding RTX toxin-like protein